MPRRAEGESARGECLLDERQQDVRGVRKPARARVRLASPSLWIESVEEKTVFDED